MKYLAILVALTMFGCADMSKSIQESSGYGKVSVHASSFDGRKEISLSSSFIKPAEGDSFSNGAIRLGADWYSDTPDLVTLTVTYVTIGHWGEGWQPISGFDLNIDGEIYKASPVEVITNLESSSLGDPSCNQFGCNHSDVKESSKKFLIRLDQLRQIQSASKAMAKISYNRTYEVSNLKELSYGNVTFIERLPEFLSTIQKESQIRQPAS